jgi:hypothetical protein
MRRVHLFALAGYMASRALRVVHFGTLLELLVRVVARNAGNPRVAGTPAFAVLQSVRLRTHRWHSLNGCQLYVPPGGVAGAAEIHGISR